MYNKKTAKQANMSLLDQDGLMWKFLTGNRLTMKIFITNTIIFFMLIDITHSIQCYRCEVTSGETFDEYKRQITVEKCLKFDGSDQFIIDCPYSTMCLKTISTYTLNNGEKRETVTRSCARQKNTTDVFRNRTWHKEHSVQEVYKEGCLQNTDNYLSGAVLTRCYCRGNLCNSSTNLHQNTNKGFIFNSLMTVIMLPKVFSNFFL